ncbi:MAG: hypothetical protein HN474_11545 [Nitrospina sp.]|nr:hypothetical protein [Nitrospina sp.]
MEENKETQQLEKKSLTKTIDSLTAELEEVQKSLQKRKRENTTLKILFYTGLFVLLVSFLYSNSVLQRAHMRSLEKNIISLEQRLFNDISQLATNIELELQVKEKKLKLIDETDIFSVLDRMDYAISRLRPKKKHTMILINRARLNTSQFSRLLKKTTRSSKPK